MSSLARLLRAARPAGGRGSRGARAENRLIFGPITNFLRRSSSSVPPQRQTDSDRACSGSAGTGTVRIGCASGFWGDTATSVPQLIFGGRLDFLVFDYLSEITMSLLTAARTKAPNLGYAPDFVHAALAPFINDIHRKGIRIVSNAGGVNPLACAEAIREVVKKAGLDLKVAVVTGDDLMPRFGWSRSDYDLLAAGSLAGHLIECGAQSTGGIFTDWHRVPDWDVMGFPVVECSPDGSFVLSKPPNTGGLVSFGTVAEQLVYEIGDPRRYLLPDVTCDFSQVVLQEVSGTEGGAVSVRGARGFPPPNDYKVCATYLDGFRATAVCPVGGPRAAEKARRTADSLIKRTRRLFQLLNLDDFSAVNVQILGAEDTYGHNARNKESREAVIWMSVHHKQKKALEVFSREIASAGTGMAPGLTGIVGGRPKVSPVLKPFFFLQPKSQLTVDIHLGGKLVESLTEAEPDTPVRDEAPPTSGDDVPDTGDNDTLISFLLTRFDHRYMWGFDPQPDYPVLCITVINEGVL
uniref:Si:ch73-132f6.5 n=1 Tax=Oryzias latipes TaxID=8090 RepID=A0A3P9MR86_ORYLA